MHGSTCAFPCVVCCAVNPDGGALWRSALNGLGLCLLQLTVANCSYFRSASQLLVSLACCLLRDSTDRAMYEWSGLSLFSRRGAFRSNVAL